MAQKACKICHRIYESGEKCPDCGSKESSDSFKGRIIIMDPEKSEIAKKIKIKNKGSFAIKTRQFSKMEIIKINKELENPLFKRKEIEILVSSKIVPNYSEVSKILSEKFSTKSENIRIKQIKGKFGTKEFVIIANIYASPQDKEAIEIMSKKEKGQKKKEEKPVEEPKQEKKPKETNPEVE